MALAFRWMRVEERVLIADPAALRGMGEVPEQRLNAALRVLADIGRRIAGDELRRAERGEALVGAVSGLRDALERHEAESSVERTRRGAAFLEDVRECPEAHARHLLGVAELFQNERRGEIGVVHRVDRGRRRVPLRDVDGNVAMKLPADLRQLFVEAVGHMPEILHEVDVIAAETVDLRQGRVLGVEPVLVERNEVQRQVFLAAEMHKRSDEVEPGAGRTADRIILVHGFDRMDGMPVKLQIGVKHGGLLAGIPENIQVGFVPNLETPGFDLVFAVAFGPVADGRSDKIGPALVVLRRSHVGLPPEDRGLAGSELFGHEGKFDKRLDADGKQEIEHVVDVHEVVDRIALFVLVVHAHFVMEEPVGAQIAEPELFLAFRELFAPGVAQTFADAPRADAVAPDVGTIPLHDVEIRLDDAFRGGLSGIDFRLGRGFRGGFLRGNSLFCFGLFRGSGRGFRGSFLHGFGRGLCGLGGRLFVRAHERGSPFDSVRVREATQGPC